MEYSWPIVRSRLSSLPWGKNRSYFLLTSIFMPNKQLVTWIFTDTILALYHQSRKVCFQYLIENWSPNNSAAFADDVYFLPETYKNHFLLKY